MERPTVALVDYGMGNLGSVKKALETVGFEVWRTSDPEDLKRAEAIVLPGVGAFGDAVKHLRELNLIDTLKRELLDRKKPFLGICLGLQLLFERSYEFGEHQGLGIFEGEVLHFGDRVHKVPHMGWNEIHPKREHPVLKGLKEGDFFYFVHSYYVSPRRGDIVLTETDYDGFFLHQRGGLRKHSRLSVSPGKEPKEGSPPFGEL